MPLHLNAAHRAEERFSDSAFRYEFWTCGKFHPDAVHMLQKAKTDTSKYQIGWKDGSSVREYANQIKAPSIRKMLDEHYFKHPLADVPSLVAVPEDLPRTA